MAPSRGPGVVKQADERLGHDGTNTAHMCFYGAAGRPFDGIIIIRLSQGKLHQFDQIPETVSATEGHTLPQEEKMIFVLGQHSQRVFYVP